MFLSVARMGANLFASFNEATGPRWEGGKVCGMAFCSTLVSKGSQTCAPPHLGTPRADASTRFPGQSKLLLAILYSFCIALSTFRRCAGNLLFRFLDRLWEGSRLLASYLQERRDSYHGHCQSRNDLWQHQI